MDTLDCRGQQCPQPVVQTRRLMLDHPGAPLRVLVDDDAARDNITRLAQGQGYKTTVTEQAGTFTLELTPGQAPQNVKGAATIAGPTILFIGSDQMGHGDPKLGQILLKNFLFTLTEADVTPDAIFFVNNGVKLAVGGSDVIEPLAKLADLGVDIASCGLCLEYFGLKEALAVGRISNMLALVEALSGAGRIIRP